MSENTISIVGEISPQNSMKIIGKLNNNINVNGKISLNNSVKLDGKIDYGTIYITQYLTPTIVGNALVYQNAENVSEQGGDLIL